MANTWLMRPGGAMIELQAYGFDAGPAHLQYPLFNMEVRGLGRGCAWKGMVELGRVGWPVAVHLQYPLFNMEVGWCGHGWKGMGWVWLGKNRLEWAGMRLASME